MKIDTRMRKKNNPHECGEHMCTLCKMYVNAEHFCFVKQQKPQVEKNYIYIIYDVETQLMEANEKGEREHRVNLVCVSHVCNQCKDQLEETSICYRCGDQTGNRNFMFEDMHPFVKHILEQRSKFGKVVAIAHNGSRFDTLFVLKTMMEKENITPQILAQGQKIIQLSYQNIFVKDSFLYFGVKLSKLPKTLGLNVNLVKGDFPFLFNTVEHENYVGQWPGLEYYDIDSKSPEEREELIKWHKELQDTNAQFNFKEQLAQYCQTDVKILTQAVIKFSNLLETKAGIQPFLNSSTIASCAMTCFRTFYMQKDTIPVVPPKGFGSRNRQSKSALQWLKYIQHSRGIKLETALDGDEVQWGKYKIDGYDPITKTAYEYNGCFWHGHTCISQGRYLPLNENTQETLQDRYNATMIKREYLQRCGLKTEHIWDCEWRQMIRDSPEIKDFVDNHCSELQDPLEPRDAFKGGRTECFRPFYECKEDETIKYSDVTSLYPWVMSKKPLPIGKPKIYRDRSKMPNPATINGLIKCKVLPPTKLDIPVLAYNAHGRLVFGLCRTCMDEAQVEDCSHSDEERAITGTFCSPEIQKALEKGYTILKTYEIYEFQMCEGVFKDYVNTFLKMKQEASGFPSSCTTEEEKRKYIADYAEHEGIKLEYDKIEYNPGLRYIAKIFLNSLFGKWGQRTDLSQTKVVTDTETFFDLLKAPHVEFQSVVPIGENKLVVTFKNEEHENMPYGFSNLAMAAFISSWARLKLYDLMDRVGINRLLYVDTDSVMYIQQRNGPDLLPIGHYLGELTDEIEPGWEICAFIGLGPKNYTYKEKEIGKENVFRTTCKIRGITLNYRARQLINFDHFYKLVKNETEQIVLTNPNCIRRKLGYKLVSRTEYKTHRNVLSKRKRKNPDGYDTLPYGYTKRQKVTPSTSTGGTSKRNSVKGKRKKSLLEQALTRPR